jgi:hypothetical protein
MGTMAELEHWESFYLITGGAAGALIGLQFVVMTLIADRSMKRANEANPAFATPTIVHFSVCLLLAALMRVPWPDAMMAATAWGIAGLLGLAYMVIVIRRMRSQNAYKPDMEDWAFHGVAPAIVYLLLALSAPWAESNETEALFAVAAASLALLFIGIHNSWDSVVFISTSQDEPPETTDETAEAPTSHDAQNHQRQAESKKGCHANQESKNCFSALRLPADRCADQGAR